jgi:D-xylose reductase|tara:strand:+ start:8907 stop:9884 length:978 start_codon:yes stop_codon:yes gene_type:complete
MVKAIKLASLEMPSVGLGLWKIEKTDAAQVVVDAIELGYRHLDSAADYGNEIEVGEGISQSLRADSCSRSDLWVTSKLWNTFHRSEHVEEACRKSLSDLGVDYLDLYLIHFPISLKYVPIELRYPPEWLFDPSRPSPKMEIDPVPLHETWVAMESLVDKGLVKNIGICNYTSGLLHDLLAYARIKPAMLQIESHPYLVQDKLIQLAQDNDIAVTAFSPLGALSYVSLGMANEDDSVLNQNCVKEAAQRLGRSPAQICLRWGIQRGTAIIPKTSRRERLLENLALFDFELSVDEMAAISSLNINKRFNDPGDFCQLAFNTFYPIYD